MKHLMRAAALLAVFPAFAAAQGREVPVSPLIVQTLEPRLGAEPAVVRTNEPFTVTYRIIYYDLTSRGKAIEVLDGCPKAEQVSVPAFKVRGVGIRNYRVGGLVVRDCTYTFTIVNEAKSSPRKQYYIPPINFKWVIRELGSEEGAKVRDWATDSVLVHYVPSVAPMPYVDVRHTGDAGSFSSVSRSLLWGARLAIVFSLAMVLLVVMRALRLRRALVAGDREAQAAAFGMTEPTPIGPDFVEVSRKRMRRRLTELCERLARTDLADSEAMLDLQRNLQATLWKLLLASLPELSRASAPSDVLRHVRALPPARYAALLVALAERCYAYSEATLRRRVCDAFNSSSTVRDQEVSLLASLNRELRWDRILRFRIEAFCSGQASRVRKFFADLPGRRRKKP